MSNIYDLMRNVASSKPVVAKKKPAEEVTLDAADGDGEDPAERHTHEAIRMEVAATVQQWVETDDLDEGESIADRLLNMMVGIADENKDGEISDEEWAVMEVALNYAFDYLTGKGVSEEDAGSLLNDWDSDAADRIRELLTSALPEGEDAGMDDIDSFAFGDGDQEAAMDDATLDAVYKKKMVIRKGKKVRINKRVSGRVRLSAKQKVAIRKAGMKSRSGAAKFKRMKSMNMRKKMGL